MRAAAAGLGAEEPTIASLRERLQTAAAVRQADFFNRTNTRVKDLIDLVLLIDREALAGDRVLFAVQATFDRRRTHDVPQQLPVPPAEWESPFVGLAAECQLAHTPITAHARVNRFWLGLQSGDTVSRRLGQLGG